MFVGGLFPGLTALGSEPGSMLTGAFSSTRSQLSMSISMYVSHDLSGISSSVVCCSLFHTNASPLHNYLIYMKSVGVVMLLFQFNNTFSFFLKWTGI